MNLTYTIALIDGCNELEKAKPVEKKEVQFLKEGIAKQIFVYEIDEYQKVYSIFGFHFSVVRDIKNYKTSKKCNTSPYKAYYSTENLSDEEISQKLRGSKTLKISEQNTYHNDNDIKVVVCEKGFIWCNQHTAFEEKKLERFEMTLKLFLIAIAYNQKSTEILDSVSSSYQSKSYKKMIEIRDEIYGFDLNYFFENPVKQDRHQQYDIWKIIQQNYHVIELHNEIKSRVVGLTNIIETKRKDTQKKWIAIFGLIISILSLKDVFLNIFYRFFK